MKVIALLIAICIISTGCKNNTKQISHLSNGKILMKRFSNGILKSEQVFSVKEGKNIPDGFYKEYYADGNVKVKYKYTKGLLDSCNATYFENGKLRSKFWMDNGVPIGKNIEYFEDGNIKDIALMSGDEKLFNAKMNDKGGIIEIEGLPLIVMMNKKNLNQGEKVKILHEVIYTNALKSKLFIEIFSIDGRSLLKTSPTIFSIDNNFYFLTTSFSKPGKFIYTVEVELSDTNNNLLKKGKVVDTINVINK